MLTYDNFVELVNEAGFLTPYTNYIDPEIFKFPWAGKNAKGQAYTNDPETDPELWKTRAPRDKKMAYGYFFNGKPGGYIAPRFFSIFVDAFRPRLPMEERYRSDVYEYEIWKLLREYNRHRMSRVASDVGHSVSLSWSDIRKKMGLEPAVKYKAEVRKLDLALKNLNMTYDTVISGTEGHLGCVLADAWVPPEWMQLNPRMKHEEALEIIYRQAEKISTSGEAKTAFRKSLRLYKNQSDITQKQY
ncbi:MAG: hypothetical protein FWC71_05825 [Defluviitaleaceae bacterium]|nr:hypothetical protein [Defluviitaleaceae bacterium]